MITAIEFRSLAAMREVSPDLHTVVISVLDGTEQRKRPRLAGFRSVLKLEFEDTYEENYGQPPGSWPEEPTPEQHQVYAIDRGQRTATLADAKRIVDFVLRHHRDPEPLTLIAHCMGGISRSAAIAAWTSARLQVPITENDNGIDYANRRVLRLLDRAWLLQQAEEDATLRTPGRRPAP